jgi:hypothetical protein
MGSLRDQLLLLLHLLLLLSIVLYIEQEHIRFRPRCQISLFIKVCKRVLLADTYMVCWAIEMSAALNSIYLGEEFGLGEGES